MKNDKWNTDSSHPTNVDEDRLYGWTVSQKFPAGGFE